MLTGGAGARAMSRAFEEVFGVADAFRQVPMAGRTDAWLVSEAADRHGLALSDARLRDFRAVYLAHLAREVWNPGPRKGIMPGVRLLLDALAERSHVALALLTGNFEQGARTKLEYFDLWRYFACGAFGDDTLDRNALLHVALARAAACGIPAPDPSRVVIIGDTPLDVAVAHAGGVRSVAVATGSHTRAALVEAGADVVLDDFSDLAASIAALEC